MRKQFRNTILDLASRDDRIVLLFGDVSVYLFQEFKERYPDRFYNVGICENTIISMAAGLSARGFHPIVHSITPFITERSFEQIKLDMCYNEFGGNIASCGASFDYAWDGATHHALTELAILRLLPRMEVIQPGSRKELDVLLRDEDLRRFKDRYLGHGYLERVAGTGKLLDTELDVKVDVLGTGRFPGDGKPKPIAFPDPATTAVRGQRFALLPLPRFVELKLASGMTASHRLHDLADVLDLIRSAKLPADFVEQLHPWVREKFRELWDAAQGVDPD